MKYLKKYAGLFINLLFGVSYCVIGFLLHSWWFVTVGAYYIILATTRYWLLRINKSSKNELFVKRFTGIMLILISFVLIGVNILSAVKERGVVFHEILMITIATYAFSKITIAIISIIKARREASHVMKTLKNVSLSDAVVSIYTMQRSMLVSFPSLTQGEIRLLNIMTGTAVWLTVLLLGINLIGGKKVDMAKSKIVKANEKIADTVTHGYKKIEEGVAYGYKKIEKGVVDGYTKIEDKFIESYLAKDGESVEEAKKRLKNNK